MAKRDAKLKKYTMKRFIATLAGVSATVIIVSNGLVLEANKPCHSTAFANSGSEMFNTQPSFKHDTDLICSHNNKTINWVTWLFQTPESSQFHYLELLELLNRDKSE